MNRSGPPRTKSVPWATLAIIIGLLGAFMAWATLELSLQPAVVVAVSIAIALGLALAAAGAVALLVQQSRRRQGLILTSEERRRRRLLRVIALIAVAFGASVWPVSYPWEWLATAITVVALAGALWTAYRLAQDDSPTAYRAAQNAYTQGENDVALERLQELEERHPEFYGVYHLRAMIHRQEGDLWAAREAAQQLIDREPQLYHGYAELGLTLLQDDQPEQACQALAHGAQVAPHLPEAHFNLGMACAEAGHEQEAVESLSRALRLGLDDQVTQLLARYWLSQALHDLGYEQAAARERRRARRLAPALNQWQSELDGGDRPYGASVERDRALLQKLRRELQEEPGR